MFGYLVSLATFFLSVYSLVFVSIEEIYQTLVIETVFHQLAKHLEFRQKCSAARRIFNSPHGIWICLDGTLFLVFDVLLENYYVMRIRPVWGINSLTLIFSWLRTFNKNVFMSSIEHALFTLHKLLE